MITQTIDISGLDGGTVSLTSEELDELASRFMGPMLRADDEGWDGAILIWNAMAAKVPSLVLRSTSVQDIAVAVGFARDHRVLLASKAAATISQGPLSPKTA